VVVQYVEERGAMANHSLPRLLASLHHVTHTYALSSILLSADNCSDIHLVFPVTMTENDGSKPALYSAFEDVI
jgi:hypothetical protein